jgi:glycine/D-amino acid oxidase-like deaminating enzyme
VGGALIGTTDPHWERLSLWHDTVDTDWTPRPGLDGDAEADVAIVGAGFTGLWTAYYLAEADPALRIVVLEAETAGFGASGRNGGWCSALFPASLDTLAGYAGRDAALAQHRAMRETVDEVARVTAAEGIDAQVAKGGTISLARSRAQWRRARAEVAAARRWDRGDDDLRLLDRHEATAVLRVTVHERTRVLSIAPGRANTDRGEVRAGTVIRATEGYTPTLRGEERTMVPVYSLIIATEPLPAATWDEIGLARRETFTDHRHLIVYGQRTADDRLVFGGRGAPYHLGSRIRPEYDRDERVFARLHASLVDLFPVLRGNRVTHAWGGALGIPRDWCASVGLDRETGLGWAGGYVGDGVATTNLAGRTLRDLVLGRDTPLTALPWVGHRSPAWEREPLRWLGINVGLRAMTLADAEESVTRLPSVAARAASRLLG